jgi:hypothetical protein
MKGESLVEFIKSEIARVKKIGEKT